MWFSSFSDKKSDQVVPLSANGVVEPFRGKGYVFNPELEAAVDVAIGLGRPLLVSGEPGGGKTELGYAIARRLGISRLYIFSTRSVSEARDLFYTYDAIRRFRDANFGGEEAQRIGAADYIEYQALGAAILDAHPFAAVRHLLDGERTYRHPQDDRDAKGAAGAVAGAAPAAVSATKPESGRSVVIIDEIDKASRDFPNDVLSELETMQFSVPELGRSGTVAGPAAGSGRPEPARTPAFPSDPALRPIIVITSNEERQLPDAFLRRCVFHEIQFPDDKMLHDIIENNLKRRFERTGLDLVLDYDDRKELLDLVGKFRQQPVDKKAGVSEIVDAAFLIATPKEGAAEGPTEGNAVQAAPESQEKPDLAERLDAAVVALAKLKTDRDTLRAMLPPMASPESE